MSPRRYRALATLLLAGILVAGWAALFHLDLISTIPTVDIAVPTPALVIDGDRVRGRITDGLPPFALHWDGQPPSAILIESTRGQVLAATAFSDDTFQRNRNAVRFVEGEARFVVDRRRWTPAAGPLIVRVEAVPSRTPFHVAALSVLTLVVALLLLVAIHRDSTTPIAERSVARRRLAEPAVFILIAAGVFASMYPGAPVQVAEDDDVAAINSYAAALDHPERLALDDFLTDPTRFNWYVPLWVSAVRATHGAGFHYATATAFLGTLQTVVLLFGFRKFFEQVSRNRSFAFVAALGLGLLSDGTMPPAGEGWSVLTVLPRMFFSACLPWVLVLALRVADEPHRWWLACAAAGLLMHIYPLSAPVLVATLLGGFWAGSDAPVRRRLWGTGIALLAAAAAFAPYAITYIVRFGTALDTDPEVSPRALAILRQHYAHLEPLRVFRELIEHRLTTFRVLLDVLAVGLLIHRGFDRLGRAYLGAAAGFLGASVMAPLVDALVATALGQRPLAVEMIRGVRYLDVFVIAALALAVRDWRGLRQGRALLVACGACALLTFGPGWYLTAYAVAGRTRLSWRILQGRPDVPTGAAQESIRAVVVLRTPDERVMGPLGLRQFDVPLAWVRRDMTVPVAYSGYAALLSADRTASQVRSFTDRPLTTASSRELSTILDTPLLFVRRSQLDDELARSERVVFENSVYAIVRIPD